AAAWRAVANRFQLACSRCSAGEVLHSRGRCAGPEGGEERAGVELRLRSGKSCAHRWREVRERYSERLRAGSGCTGPARGCTVVFDRAARRTRGGGREGFIDG